MQAHLMKLGKKPPRKDARNLQYKNYMKAVTLPYAPGVSHFPNAAPLLMLKNDILGCCVIAMMFHMRMIWNKAHGITYIPTDAEVIAAYSAIGGYDPNAPLNPDGSNPTDNGCDMLTAMNYWRQTGIGNDKNKILAFVQVDQTNWYEMQHALYFFGGLARGLGLPIAAQSMNNTKFGWTNPPGQLAGIWAPNSWGGHATAEAGYGSLAVDTITWGERIPEGKLFYSSFTDEVYVIISEEYIPNPSAEIDNAINYTALLSDLASATS